MNLSNKINEIWKLINETAILLNRTTQRSRYDSLIAALRLRLQNTPANSAVLQEVQYTLTELRKKLRLSGYDLSMGKYDLIFDGFHNDEVLGSFSRMVLFINKSGVFYWQTGTANHIDQASLLEKEMYKIAEYSIVQKHYLWFRWTKTTLTLSGSATESTEKYQQLKDYAQADPLLFLSRLKKLN